MRVHLFCIVLVVLATACFLLAAFWSDHIGPTALVPLGLGFGAAALLVHHIPVPVA